MERISMDPRWRVCLLDTKDGNPNHYIVLAIEAALRNHPHVELVRCPGHADALPVAIKEQCNLFLAFDGEGLDRGLCRRLASVCGTSVLWVTEDPYERDVNVRNAGLFDFVFTNDSGSVQSYEGGAHHLPLAAYPKFNLCEIPSQDENHYLYDLFFVGTAWPNRVDFLKALLARMPGMSLKIGLTGNEHLPAPNLDLPPSSYAWRVPNSEMARLANRSRVVLTLHRDFSGSGCPSQAATPGPRLFEVALAGGFQLVDLSLPETSAFFRVDEEFVGFRTLDECCEQIRCFLDKPTFRLTIARAAQRRCLAEHLYEHRVDRLLGIVSAKRPAAAQRASIARAHSEKIRVLYVAHNVVNVRPFGGVEVYVDELVRKLPERYEPFVYYPDRRYPLGQVMVCENARTGKKTRKVLPGPIDEGSLHDFERESYFAELLHERRIDLVHVQHLIGHPWSLPLVARTLGLPVVMNFSDHFAVCTHFNLIHSSRQYCNIPARPAGTCDYCLREQDGARVGSQASRRAFIAAILANVDLMVFPSESAREITKSLYAAVSDDARVWVEGLPISDRPQRRLSGSNPGPLQVVVAGNFDHIKGGDALCRVFDSMRSEDIEFHVYGHVRPPYDEILRALAVPNVRLHGAYEPGSIRASLDGKDAGLFLSIWPETYLLTLSEAWNAGVVPIVSDIGAAGERVAHRVNGLKVPVNEPASVVNLLRELISDRRELQRLRRAIHPGLYCTISGHVQRLTRRYEELLDEFAVRLRGEEFFGEKPARRAASAGNLFRMESTWLTRHASGSADAALVSSGKPVWKKALPYLRAHGFKATARRSAEKILEKLMLFQGGSTQ
jgi:glycosyltransferase involved in cell wall biosynthesis/spore maturation protein CgeB